MGRKPSHEKIIEIFLICFIALSVSLLATLALAQGSVSRQEDLATALQSYSQHKDSGKKETMVHFGLPQMKDLGVAQIAAYVIFGTIGLCAFIYGKKNSSLRPLMLGAALMAYPYFITGTLGLYLVGIILSALLYFWR